MGKQDRGKVCTGDQHPSREEIAGWRVAGTLRGDGGAGKLSEVFCAVYCNKYLYILQFASYESSFLSSVYIFFLSY